ncbi:MAG: hypothetical protein M3488_10345 [Actinomycetota bacterium]|nr:hypothetical protein [Actinomycetota bacterium]
MWIVIRLTLIWRQVQWGPWKEFGETPQEALTALTELLTAKEAWLDAARQGGKPIPDPSYQPVATG